ncbi:MAG: linear amide C-N hydrolase [Anaerolineae bacterium]|nr:linear amide C-N hydrolase [Anaerolineae bacterium]
MYSGLITWLLTVIMALLSPFLTLGSVEQIDAYPLYTMTYTGDYEHNITLIESFGALMTSGQPVVRVQPAWGCSLFVALGDAEGGVYGRNFDWVFSPAVLLFTDPPDGYASVSMVDIAFLGFTGRDAGRVMTMSPEERTALLYAPFAPIDGMNEYGLVVGMAAVPEAWDSTSHPERDTIDSLHIMREVLDHARTADEAVAIFERYTILAGGGPPVHYLIADAAGHTVLIEYVDGEMVVQRNTQPWDMATNFTRALCDTEPENMCQRYRIISEYLSQREGKLTPDEAMRLLESVSQDGDYSTEWSAVYDIHTGDVHVVMNRQYDTVHTLTLPLAIP